MILAAGLSACGHEEGGGRHGWGGGPGGDDGAAKRDFGPTYAQYFRRFDANKDGRITRDELDKVLHAEFDALDLKHDQKLDLAETRAANGKLMTDYWNSPVLDWNGDGVISFEEFATQWTNAFDVADGNKDGVLDAEELAAPMSRPVRGHEGGSRLPAPGKGGDGGESGGGRRPGG